MADTAQSVDLEVERAGEPAWVGATRRALADAPDPARARELAAQVIAAQPAALWPRLSDAPPETLARVLAATCGIAPFFAPYLVRHPEELARLAHEDYTRIPELEILRRRLDAALEAEEVLARENVERDAAALALRRFKYYELARITVRDTCPDWLPLERSGETLAELSRLADLILDAGLELVRREVRERFGAPRWRIQGDTKERELGFCVLGLGKLGSEELNYSSDVDLVYVYEAPPDAVSEAGGDATTRSPVEYFTRIGQLLGGLLSTSSAEGFLYRVDLDLRPEGAQGNVVISDAALASYYESWADTWEKAAFMKARPVAGDEALGWRTIRGLDPILYRSTMDYDAVRSIEALKAKVESAHGRREAGFNVKIDAGGIRDIEFIAQAMQLLHGGRVPQIRACGTQDALGRLGEAHVLPQVEVDTLLDSYRYLRRVENRLQMEGERQTHRVREEAGALRRLARALGHLGDDAVARFQSELAEHRSRVVDFFADFLTSDGTEQIYELFVRNVPGLLALESSRNLIRDLSDRFAREVATSADAQLALNNLDRFIQGLGQRRFYYELLMDRPELVPRLTAAFAASKYLSNILASHPKLIEPVFADPAVLIPARDAMRADLDALVAAGDDPERDAVEHRLDCLRLFMNRQVLNAGLLDIADKLERREVEAGLTDVAEVCLEAALEFAREWLAQRADGVPPAAAGGAFLIVGMGKLASRELSYGSDLDVIFLFEPASDDPGAVVSAQDYFVRLAQRVISCLQTSTGEGACYEIDARLRPSGNQGLLVTSLASFERYHQDSAEPWERQILLRARPVVGDAELAESFEQLRREILLRDLPDDLAGEIHRIRQRMESELARETSRLRNFKTGRGGVLDVENAVQYLQLRHARECEALLDVVPLADQLARLEAEGFAPPAIASPLREGWEFLQRLGNRLRIVENRSITDLDEERGDLDGLARRLGYEDEARESSARRSFLDEYNERTEAVRRAYLATLGVEEDGA